MDPRLDGARQPSRRLQRSSARWGLREIRLLDCLMTLLQRGTTVRLKTGTEDASVGVVRELERRANDIDSSEQLITKSSALLHTKGLLTSRCLIRGSMNFTLKGIYLNEEAVTYDVDKSAIAEMRIALDDQW